MRTRHCLMAASAAVAVALAGCADQPYYPGEPGPGFAGPGVTGNARYGAPAYAGRYSPRESGDGRIVAIDVVQDSGHATGGGALLGGIAGGVLGHQIGSGRGNTAATIVGAGAGAYAGNEVEKNKKKQTYWSVSVKMDNGTTRSYTYSNKPEFRDGDRVKTLEDGRRLALIAN